MHGPLLVNRELLQKRRYAVRILTAFEEHLESCVEEFWHVVWEWFFRLQIFQVLPQLCFILLLLCTSIQETNDSTDYNLSMHFECCSTTNYIWLQTLTIWKDKSLRCCLDLSGQRVSF